MFSDFLQDSPVYQEVYQAAFTQGKDKGFAEGKDKGFAEGKDKGFAEGKDEGFAEGVETGKVRALSKTRQTLSQGLLDLVTTRFPHLEALARKCVNEIDDTDTLSYIFVKIGTARTRQEVARLLEEFRKA